MTRFTPSYLRRLPRTAALVLAAPLAVLVGCSVVGVRTTEEAGHEVLRVEGPFELRRYRELVTVETTVSGSYEEAGDIAFRRLFDYISGENVAQSSLEMTAPVTAEQAAPERGEEIAMTAPVFAEGEGESWTYAFVLPARYTMESAPVPTNPALRLRLRPAEDVAVVRYSGLWREDAMLANTRELTQWIETQGLVAGSAVRSAGYDPPWTLPFLRRNEILIDVR